VELVDKNRGELVLAGDEAGFAAAVERLLSRPAWRAELGNNARKFAEGKFSLDNVRAQYEACYRELLQRKGVRTSPETWRPKTEARRNG